MYKHSLGRTSSDVPAFSSRSLNSLQLSVNRFLSIHIFVFSARLQMSSWPTLSRTDRMLSKIIGEGKRSCFDVMGTRSVSIATDSRDRFAQNVVSLPFGQTAWKLISHIGTMCANFGPDLLPRNLHKANFCSARFCANLSALIYFRAHTAVLDVVDTNKHLEMQRILGVWA